MRASRFLLILVLVSSVSGVATPAAAQDDRKYETPSDVVAWLYRDFAYVAVFGDYWKDAGVALQPRKVLQKYFTDELADLFVKDRECAVRTHEVCNLDWDPIFASQDPGATGLEVSKPDASNVVRVTFSSPGGEHEFKLAFHVLRTSSGWRIADIVDAKGGSIRKVLGR